MCRCTTEKTISAGISVKIEIAAILPHSVPVVVTYSERPVVMVRALKLVSVAASRMKKPKTTFSRFIDLPVRCDRRWSLVEGVRLRDTVTGEERELAVSGLFVAIGHDPRSDLVAGQVELDSQGYVLTQGKGTRTNIDGVFACGDLVDHEYRQAITAAGTGCSAALDAERHLADLDHAAKKAGAGVGREPANV